MVTYLDPRAAPGLPVDAYDLALADLDAPVTIGLLANGFPDSVRFLDHVETALRAALPAANVRRYDKGDPTSVCPDEMATTIVEECEAVVASYGH